jgi:hypothetical protein
MFYLGILLLLIGTVTVYRLQRQITSHEENRGHPSIQDRKPEDGQPLEFPSSANIQPPSSLTLYNYTEAWYGGMACFSVVPLAFTIRSMSNTWLMVLLVVLVAEQVRSGIRRLCRGVTQRLILDRVGIRQEQRTLFGKFPEHHPTPTQHQEQPREYLLQWHEVVSVSVRKHTIVFTLANASLPSYTLKITDYAAFSTSPIVNAVKTYALSALQYIGNALTEEQQDMLTEIREESRCLRKEEVVKIQ